ncbi:MAG: protein kinase, partial [Pseudomonadota bacterium]|nr:protein kinase [Pseudomonadota bacterium]
IWAGHAPLAARFVRERQLLASLQHPHIAQLLDGGIDAAGKPWLAMELVRGVDIVQWCDAHHVPLSHRAELLMQVCDAVDHAHRQLIVHRDIKPSNIMVDTDGQAKLLDFGIARLLDDDDERTQTLAMTPAWATPEQRQGRPVTTASDVYQLGLLARTLLCGLPRGDEMPRMSRDYAQTGTADPARAQQIADARALSPDALQRQLRGDLDSIVALATAHDPDERYPSARALADDLKAWLRGQPVQARGDERGYRTRRTLRRWWPALAAGLVGLGFLGYHLHSLDRALQRTSAERARAVSAERKANQERVLAEQERDNAAVVAKYMVSLFDAAAPSATRQGDISARQLLAASEGELQRIGAKRHSPRALGALWQSLSEIHSNLGDVEHAAELADRAVDAQQGANDPRSLAEALRRAASTRYATNETDLYITRSRQAADVLEQAGLTADPIYPRALGGVALGYAMQARFDQALPAFDRAIAAYRRLGAGGHTDLAVGLLNAGATALAAGDLVRAQRWLDEAEPLGGSEEDTRLLIAMNRVKLAIKQGRPTLARSRADALLPQARRYYGAGHPRLSSALNHSAEAWLALSEPMKALAALEESRVHALKAYGDGHGALDDIDGLRAFALLATGQVKDARVILATLAERRAGAPAVESESLLEAVALARANCDRVAQATAWEHHRAHPGAAPWERKLADAWRPACVK